MSLMNCRFAFVLLFYCALLSLATGCGPKPLTPSAPAAGFRLTSASIAADALIPKAQVYDGNQCGGENLSPALNWAGAPAQTKSFAFTAYDPDAGGGKGWWHWAVCNLPTGTTSLPVGASRSLPSGATQTRNDFGASGYGGPCPPVGDKPHRYVFTVYALDTASLPATGNDAAALDAAIKQHTLAKATFTARYGR